VQLHSQYRNGGKTCPFGYLLCNTIKMKIKVKLLKALYPYQKGEECMIDEYLVYGEFKDIVQIIKEEKIETIKEETMSEKIETKDIPKKRKTKAL
jgi:hypothetical protein